MLFPFSRNSITFSRKSMLYPIPTLHHNLCCYTTWITIVWLMTEGGSCHYHTKSDGSLKVELLYQWDKSGTGKEAGAKSTQNDCLSYIEAAQLAENNASSQTP
jgi:hypothetical protein